MAMILFGNWFWNSPYVLSVFVSLREKNLPFSVESIALHEGKHYDPAFTEPSLTARVPTLLDGDFYLSESSAIIEYLEETYAPPAHPRVLPAGVRERARARQLMAWIRSDLLALREERSSEYVFYPQGDLPPLARLSQAAERAAAKLLRIADRVVPADAGSLFGPWCIADTDLAMMLQRLVKTGYPVEDRIRRYADAQWARAAVAEFVRHERPPYIST